MGKLLSWVAIGFAIYVAYKIVLALQRKSHLEADRARRANGTEDSGEAFKPGSGASGQASGETRLITLVSCAHCGVQLPRDEAVRADPHFFCGSAHAQLGPVKDRPA
jgi:uncharacterized protein